ncbi:MAG: type II toxin-antitoxin system HicA family toxin, partial [Deltaproteobacteria bacterium]|nr:type II toxin-antitoxin system HicA family toxin [Deltaproteobacteria bacterium]
MTRLPRFTGKEMLAMLERGGFRVSHVSGSHYYLCRGDSAIVVVPVHGNHVLP